MTSRRLAVGATALAVAGPLASAGNFLFHAVASRHLGPDHYGALTALLVLTVAVAVPAAALQMSLARSLLGGETSARRLLSGAGRAAALVVVVLVLTAPALGAALHLDGPAPVIALCGYLAATVVGLVPKAVLVAEERLLPLATTTALGVAVRLGLGVAWLAAGGGLTAAVVAGSVGEVVALLGLLLATRRSYRPGPATTQGWRAHVSPMVALGGLWILLGLDTVVARLLLDGDASGNYGAAGVLAKAVLFLPQAVATAAFARMADPRTRQQAVAWGTALAFAAAAVSTTALALVGAPAARLLFGSDFVVDRTVLVVLATAAALLAVVNLWVHARIAVGQPVALRALVPLAVALVVMPLAARSPLLLAGSALAVAAVAMATTRPAAMVAAPFPDPTHLIDREAGLDLTMVVPLYEGGGRVVPHLRRLVHVLEHGRRRFEVIVVDDGSTDAGPAEVEAAGLAGVRVERLAHGGKGHALLHGLSLARGELIGFIDADGDIDAEVVPRLVRACSAVGVDGAVAAKEDDARSAVRRLATPLFRRFVAVIADPGVRDTQTGAKVFRRETVAAFLPWASETGYTFDVEVLAIARRLGYRNFVEVPTTVRASQSTLRPADVVRMAASTTQVAARVAQLPLVSARALESTRDASEALRILVLNWKCHRHPAAGGAERYTHEVLRRWAAAGHQVTLFAPAVAGAPAEEIVDGYRIVRSGTRLTVYRDARHFWFAHRDAFDVIVDEGNTRPFEAPLWADVPVVGLFHQLAREVWWHETPLPVAAAGRFVLEPTWHKAYRSVPVATVSASSALSLRAAGFGQVVNVGCGLTLPSSLPLPAQGDVPTVAFVARLVSAKRPLDAIEGFALARRELGDARMWIMGDGPMAERVRDVAATVPGVEVLGSVGEAEKFERLARSHVLAVTSVREGWGLVVDEAAAVGAHAVGYRVPGLVDSVPAAGGDLVEPTPQALAVGLVHRLGQTVGRPGLSRGGGTVSWDVVADRLLSTVRMASTPGPARPTGETALLPAARGG